MITNGDNSIKIQETQYLVNCFSVRYFSYLKYDENNGIRKTITNFDKLLKTENEVIRHIKKKQEKYMDRDYKYDKYCAHVTYTGSLDEATEWYIKYSNELTKRNK